MVFRDFDKLHLNQWLGMPVFHKTLQFFSGQGGALGGKEKTLVVSTAMSFDALGSY